MICKELIALTIISVSLYRVSAITDPRLTVVNVYSGLKGVTAGGSEDYPYSSEEDESYDADSGEAYRKSYNTDDESSEDAEDSVVNAGVASFSDEDSVEDFDEDDESLTSEELKAKKQRKLHKMMYYKSFADRTQAAASTKNAAVAHKKQKHGGRSRKVLRSRKKTH